jgi:hypothetical protein
LKYGLVLDDDDDEDELIDELDEGSDENEEA